MPQPGGKPGGGKPGGGKQRHRKHFYAKQQKRSAVEADEIAAIETALQEGAPPRGSNPLAAAAANGAAADGAAAAGAAAGWAAARRFDDLPISEYSKQGLREAKYVTLTAVQRAALPHALCGRDVLGAAKTGSGKTLAFLLPVVEALYRHRWSKLDGLGALVISPTRELALQIFDELRKVGRRHDFSAGLLIGGKDVKEEQARVHEMNILVCTPGRLLQHMDETPGFDAGQLQVLVLDEADRILDMGFSATLNAIVANIPRSRQTLLFSATQTKSVKDLARLSLKDPEYISVHSEASTPTPLKLQQAYMVCELPQKLDILWSFIKTHLKAKTIIFVSTCKQVRFLFEAFRKLRPGVPLRALHGKMAQIKRMGVFYEFCEAKAMVLFATDIAARGLDFPTVDWVVQADCPEDVASYIHRVGRTARYVSSGKGLLLLLPSERDGMLAQLEEAKVPVKQLKHNPAKVQPVTPALQALLSKDAELKEVAQRALVSYLRSVFLQPNRKVFDVTQLPAAEFAYSMGLPTAPKLRFLKKAGKKMKEVVVGGGALQEPREPHDQQQQQQQQQQEEQRKQAQQRRAANGAAESDSEEEEEEEQAGASSDGEAGGSGSDGDGEGGRRQRGAAPAAKAAAGSDSDDDLLVVKRRNVYEVDEDAAAAEVVAEAAAAAEASGKKQKKKKLKIKAGAVSGSRVVFDDDGEAVDPLALLAQEEEFGEEQEERAAAAAGGGLAGLDTGIHGSVAERAAAARAVMLQRDREDKAALRELRKTQRQEKRAKRLAREAPEGGVAVLGGGSGSGSEAEDESDYSSSEEEEEEADGRGRGRRRGAAAVAGVRSDSEEDSEGDGSLDMDLLESSDDEGPSGRGRRPAETAHFGMLPAKPAVQQQQDEEDEEEEEEEEEDRQPAARGKGSRGSKRAAAEAAEPAAAGSGGGTKKKAKAGATAGLSLAEQEALALRLLGARR